MSRKTDERSFFEWALPDWMDGRVTMLGLIFLLVLMALGLLGMTIKHLSVDGGTDQVAAGYPYFDGGIPRDQIAAAFPGQDEPEPVWLGDPVVDEDLVDEGDVDEDGIGQDGEHQDDDAGDPDDGESGSGISDESPPVIDLEVETPPTFRAGTWNISVVESGDAACGYPDEPIEYDVTLTVAPTETDDDTDDDAYEIRLEHPWQLFSGLGSGLPVHVESDGEGYTDVLTITEFDVEAGTFRATEEYTAPDGCVADRLWIGTISF